MFFTKINSISTQELADKMQKEKLYIIDVREKDEYASGHIKGAINMPLSNINAYTLSSNAYIICQSGMRSRNASKHFIKKGYNVVNVSGGMSAWKGPVVK